MRLNSEHHEKIVSFAEEHHEIITNKFMGLNARQNQIKPWEILENQLNALGYGILSVAEYKRRISAWKSKIKAKAVDGTKSINKTGGGEGVQGLTKIEVRLLAIMGNKSYEGDIVKEQGFKRKKEYTAQDMSRSEKTKEGAYEEDTPIEIPTTSKLFYSSPPSLSFINKTKDKPSENLATKSVGILLSPSASPSAVSSCKSPSKSEYHRRKIESTPSVSTSRRRNMTNMSESIKTMNNESLQVLKSINKNLEGVNNNLTGINRSLATICSILTEKLL